uniref:PABPN1 like, cytoplasmic n=1 Tax=Anser brachyrhynchus TaxID=132585 RepID=A0A8B9B7I6_9AVES
MGLWSWQCGRAPAWCQLCREPPPAGPSAVAPSSVTAALVSAGLFPKTTEEKMEVDQRSIYVGNVSGRPWGRAHLPAPCPVGVCCAPYPGDLSHFPAIEAGPKLDALLLPSTHWECGLRLTAQHLPVILSHLQVTCCKHQPPQIPRWKLWIVQCSLFPQSRAVPWIWGFWAGGFRWKGLLNLRRWRGCGGTACGPLLASRGVMVSRETWELWRCPRGLWLQVDYGGTAEELESHFNSCGQINRVTILCDKFSGHPKGYAYIEFEEKSSVKAAVELDESLFRGRVIKVLPKRTNMPGISSTDRGGHRGRFQARGGLAQRGGYYGGQQARLRGRTYRGRARLQPWYFPY